MNFYKHHIGDYAQATSHLSFVEDAAYSRLIRKYYAEEAPLPADPKAVQRLVGARTKEEREAVVTVLEEFFSLEADGWHNKRCDAELAKANAQAETNRRIAEEREAKKRARIEHASLNDSKHEPSTNRSPATIAEREPSQTPDARHQTPDLKEEGRTSTVVARAGVPEESQPTRAGLACRRMKTAGLADVNPSHPKLIALLEAGITDDELASAAADAVQRGKGFAYALAAAEGRRRDAAVAPLPTAQARQQSARLVGAGVLIGAISPTTTSLETFDAPARALPT